MHLAISLIVLVAAQELPLTADAALGLSYLQHARAKTPVHLFKPSLRVGLRAAVTPRLELGGAGLALLAGNHYRVLGALGHARYAVIDGARAALGASVGLGLGHDADILHADLGAARTVAPYWSLALDVRHTVARSWLLGLEIGWHSAALVQLGLVAGRRFGGAP